MLTAAALALLRAVEPVKGVFVSWAAQLPLDPLTGAPGLAFATGTGYLALSVGLLRGKRLAWWLAITTFGAAFLAQATLGAHPVGLTLAGIALAVLLAQGRRYAVETAQGARLVFVACLATAATAVLIETLIILGPGAVTPVRLARDLGDTLAALTGSADPTPLLRVGRNGALLLMLALAVRLPVVLGALGVLAMVPEPVPDPHLRSRARAIAARYGAGALLPFQLGDDKRIFAPPGGDGIVVYGLAGRTAVVLGEPIGPPGAAWSAFGAFLRTSHRHDRAVVVYQASETGRRRLEAAGMRAFRIGQEALVDLADFDLAGPRRANLRHTVARARRGGVTVRWFPKGIRGPRATALLEALASLDAAWRASNRPQLGFTIGGFSVRDLRRTACAVALGPDGTPEAFVTFRPTGRDGGFVLDLLRRRTGGTPGAIEACLAEAAMAMRESGAASLSLGLAPLAGLDAQRGPVEERLMALAARGLRRWYDVDGLRFFKAKFDPLWVPRYAAIEHRRDALRLGLALLRVHLGGWRHAAAQLLRASDPADVRESLQRLRARLRGLVRAGVEG
jgi:lysylphosphatidylglycerol synthetase-like protein (DUF2156 family)